MALLTGYLPCSPSAFPLSFVICVAGDSEQASLLPLCSLIRSTMLVTLPRLWENSWLPICLAQQFLSGDILCPNDTPVNNTPKSPTNNDIAMKRLDLFHSQFEKSQEELAKEVIQQKELKLQKILQYTTDTFCRIGLTEHETFQIRECVEYLVKNEKVLSLPDLKIERRPEITQISLKNFAWNIAYQYKLPGQLAAQFVMTTFHEWFADSTLYTVVKNLKTTSGNHAIPIDTHILKKY